MDKQLYLAQIDRVNREGKYKPDWDSLAKHPVPDWFRECRLGIFLHWGVFSVPAYHDWYARNIYIQGSPEYEYHLKHYGHPKDFGFKDFIPMFTMENYDPQQWVKMFREAGADYIVPVAEHHDGFQNYGSALSRWNAVDMGPHRDVMGELLLEADRAGMTLGASSHRVEHWWFLGHGREFDSDIPKDPQPDDYAWPAMPEPDNYDLHSRPYPSDEFLTDWLLRCCEIVDKYHPRILYFDWWIQHEAVKPYLKRFAAYYFNRMEEHGGCVISYKQDALPFGIGVPDVERGQFAEAKSFLWQSCTSAMRHSWCYSIQPDKAVFKSPAEIVCDLIDVVSKNGRLLLNFGPKPDGTICEQEVAILHKLAEWMRVNDEAVHGTTLWRVAQEGPTKIQEGQFADGAERGYTSEDIRFTCSGSAVYATCLKCPDDGRVTIRSLRCADASHLPVWHGIVRRVEVLGGGECAWTRDGEGLHVDLGSFSSDMPVVVKVITD